MELYEYLIGGKKTGRIEDLKDTIPGSKPFCELKKGDSIFVSHFGLDGTCIYAYEEKITSIVKYPSQWVFTGFSKRGTKYEDVVWVRDLDKTFFAWDQRTSYKVFGTFKMDDEPLFELAKKEIKNSKK